MQRTFSTHPYTLGIIKNARVLTYNRHRDCRDVLSTERLTEQIVSLELIIKELQGLVHDSKHQAEATKQSLEREQACKADLLSENTELQKQLESVSEEAKSVRKELVEVKKHAHEPTPEALAEKGVYMGIRLKDY